MQAQPYSAWSHTAYALHMMLQMMGKVKLKRMPSQPEWNHTLLHLTPSGFTTGLIPDGPRSFEIQLDLHAATLAARCTTGLTAGFPLRESHSVAEYYASFMNILDYIGHPVKINTTPQEVPDTRPFETQTERHDFDTASARNYFDTAVFAHNALLAFASPLRTKKILPALFWGTFDMTTVIFSGEERPFAGEGLIEKVAFDEQFIEIGFWPGDPQVDDPTFFVLPYPFLEKPLPDEAVSPREAFFSEAKKEYFLKLSDVLAYENPSQVVTQFCRDAFQTAAEAEGWQNLPWFTKPLLC